MSEAAASFPTLSPTRRIEDFPIGNLPLAAHQRRWTADTGICVAPHAWLDVTELKDFMAAGAARMLDASGQALAWRDQGSGNFSAKASFLIRHPWDLLRANECYVSALTESVIEGDVHPSAVIEGVMHLGSGTRILPGVFIEGNVVIGKNCKIGPNCYLRGNTSIGDHCHIGQSVEIKNCLILSKTNVGHLSYVGDSVLGENVNFGAGTTVSNLRHDGKTHHSMVGDELIDTGRRKFGTIVGDGVHTGIQTSIYPGRNLWPGTTTLPGAIVRKDLKS